MAFAFTGQMQLLGPTNVKQIASSIQAQLSGLNSRSLSGINSSLEGIVTNAKAAGSAIDSFGAQAGLAARRFVAFGLAAGSIISLTVAIKSGIGAAIEYERQLVRLKQTGGGTADEIKGLSEEIGNVSTSLGVSSKELVQATVTLRQAGLSLEEIKTLTRTIGEAKLSPSFTGDLTKLADTIIAIKQQFKQSAEQVNVSLNSISAVAAGFAVEFDDISEAIKRAGGTFASLGGDLNQLIGLFSSVRASTRQSAESIATGLNTIFARLQRPETVEILQELNINLRRTREEAVQLGNIGLENAFVGPYEAIRRLSEGLRNLPTTDPRFAQITESIGGYRQIRNIIPLLREFSEAERARLLAMTATNSLIVSADVAQESLSQKTKVLTENFQQLIRTISESSGFQFLASSLLQIANTMVTVTDAIKPLLPLFTAFLGAKIIGSLPSFLGSFGKTVSTPNIRLGSYARGGVIPGTGNTDSVPAMLMPGEFVMRKDAAQQIGYDNLSQFNRMAGGGRVRMANGGFLTQQKINDLLEEFSKSSGIAFTGVNVKPRTGLVASFDKTKPSLGKLYKDKRGDRIALNQDLIQDEDKLRLVLSHELGHYFDINASGDRSLLSSDETSAGAAFAQIAARKRQLSDRSRGVVSNAPEYTYSRREAFANLFSDLLLKGPEGTLPGFAEFVRSRLRTGNVLGQGGGNVYSYTLPSQGYYPLPTFQPQKGVSESVELAAQETVSNAILASKFYPKYPQTGRTRRLAGGGQLIQYPYVGSSPVGNLVTNKLQGILGGIPSNNDYAKQLAFRTYSAEALRYIPKGSTFLGNGAVGMAVLTPEGDVIRTQSDMGREFNRKFFPDTMSSSFNPYRPNIEGVLQAYDFRRLTPDLTGGLGNTYIEKLPFAESLEKLNLPEVEKNIILSNLKNQVRKQGYEFGDAKYGNIGRVGGQYYVIDPGAVYNTGRTGLTNTKKFAEGGAVDSIPALLTPGEFVINRDSAQSIGYGRLNAMNQHGRARFKDGGIVGGVWHAAGAGQTPRTVPVDIFQLASQPGLDLSNLVEGYKQQLKLLQPNLSEAQLLKASQARVAAFNARLVEVEQLRVGIAENTLKAEQFTAVAQKNAGTAIGAYAQKQADIHQQLVEAEQKQLTPLLRSADNVLFQGGQAVGFAGTNQQILAKEKAGELPQPTFGTRLKNALTNPNTYLLTAAVVAPFAAGIIENQAGTPQQAITEGGESGFKAAKAGAGFLTGSATGAFAGAAFSLGPVGIGIAALGAGLIGITSSLSAASEEIRRAKIDQAVTSLGINLNNLNARLQQGLNPTAEELSGLSSKLKDLSGATEEEAKSRATTRFLGVPIGFNTDTFQKSNQKVFEQNIQQQLPILQRVLRVQGINLARDNTTARPQDLIQQLLGDESNAANLRAIARGTRTTPEAQQRLLQEEIRDAQLATRRQQTEFQEQRLFTAFGRLVDIVETATIQLAQLDEVSKVLSGTLNGAIQSNPISIPRFPIGTPQFGEQFGRLANVFGNDESGQFFRQYGQETNRIAQILPNVLSAAFGSGSPENTLGRTRTLLRQGLGFNETEQLPQATSTIIQGIISKLEAIKPAEFIRRLRGGDAGGLAQEALGNSQKIIEDANQKLAQVTEQFTNIFERRLTDIAQQRLRAENTLFEASQLALQGRRQEVEFQLSNENRRSELFQRIPVAEFNVPFEQRNARLVQGIPGAGSGNSPAVLGATLRDLTRQLPSAQEVIDRANPQDRLGAVRNRNSLVENISRLQNALQNLTRVTELTAAAQERLGQIDKEQEGRLGAAQKLFTATGEELSDFNQGLFLTAQALQSPTGLNAFNNTQNRLIFQSTDLFRGVPLPGFGGQTGEELQRSLLQRSTGIANLSPETQNEQQRLQTAIVEAFRTGTQAFDQLRDNQLRVIDNLADRLATQNDQFLSRLAEVLRGAERERLQEQIGLLNIDRGRLQGITGQAQEFGLNSAQLRALTTPEQLQNVNRYITQRREGESQAARLNETADRFRRAFSEGREAVGLPLHIGRPELASALNGTGLSAERIDAIYENARSGRNVRLLSVAEDLEDRARSIFASAGNQVAGRITTATGFSIANLREHQFEGFTNFLNDFQNFAQGRSLDQLNTETTRLTAQFNALSTRLESLRDINQPERQDFPSGVPGVFPFADGGLARGTDTVPAMLTPGEFIVNARDAQANRGILSHINSGARYFADGGNVYPGGFDARTIRELLDEGRRIAGFDIGGPGLPNRGPGQGLRLTEPDEQGNVRTELADLNIQENTGGFRLGANGELNSVPRAEIDRLNNRDELLGRLGLTEENAATRIGQFRNPFGFLGNIDNPDQAFSGLIQRAQIQRGGIYGGALGNEQRGLQSALTLGQRTFMQQRFQALAPVNIPGRNESLTDYARRVGGAFGGAYGSATGGGFSASTGIPRAGNLGVRPGFGINAPFGGSSNSDNPYEGMVPGIGPTSFRSIFDAIRRRHFAEGGYVGDTDTVPAMLTPGEYVLSKSSVDRAGLANVQHFAEGGLVKGGTGGTTNFADLANALSNFTTGNTALVEALQAFPKTLTLEGNQRVEVIINGADILSKIVPMIKNMINEQVKEKVGQVFEAKLPDLGPTENYFDQI